MPKVDHVSAEASCSLSGIWTQLLIYVRTRLDKDTEGVLGLLRIILADIVLVPAYSWLCTTLPISTSLLNRLPFDPSSQAAMAAAVCVSSLLVLVNACMDRERVGTTAVIEVPLIAAGLYLFPHFMPFGLDAVACVFAVVVFSRAVSGVLSPGREDGAKRWRWRALVLACMCVCACVALSAMGRLPYASGRPKSLPDDQRKLSANTEIIESLMVLDEWDVGCREGVEMLQAVAMIESRFLDIPPEEEPSVELGVIPNATTVAYYSHETNTIVVSPFALSARGSSGFRALHAVCHEMAHAWQHRAIEDPSILDGTRMPLGVDEGRIDRWVAEFRSYESGWDGNLEAYASQDCEQFADEYADDAVLDYWRQFYDS